MATNKSKRKQKDDSGSKQGEDRAAKAKPKIKVTAVTNVDFGIAPATVKKPEEPKTPSAPKKHTVPGVRTMRTRPYLAGTIVAKHGLAAGVTDGMVRELDVASGKPNPTESRICLKNAFHAVRGYQEIAVDSVE